jgi:hypothetical protein
MPRLDHDLSVDHVDVDDAALTPTAPKAAN